MKSLVLIIAMGGVAFGSQITSASATTGTIYDAAYVTSGMTSTQLNGSQVSGTGFNCTFVGNVCSGGGVTLSVTAGADTAEIDTVWTITNSRGTALDSLTITLVGAVFNPCMSGNTPLLSISSCDSATPGASSARTVNGDMSFGTTNASATVAYSNALRLGGSGGTVYNDAYTQIVLTFSNNFNTSETFTFVTDTDIAPALGGGGPTGVPEPSTYGLVGGALAGLALLRRRRSNKI